MKKVAASDYVLFSQNHDISYISEKQRTKESQQMENKLLTQMLIDVQFFNFLCIKTQTFNDSHID